LFSEFSLVVNVDGLPLSKSCNSHLWPILCIVREIKGCKPFPVGIYHGDAKPQSVSDYLREFIDELRTLSTAGLQVNDRSVKLNLGKCISSAMHLHARSWSV